MVIKNDPKITKCTRNYSQSVTMYRGRLVIDFDQEASIIQLVLVLASIVQFFLKLMLMRVIRNVKVSYFCSPSAIAAVAFISFGQ